MTLARRARLQSALIFLFINCIVPVFDQSHVKAAKSSIALTPKRLLFSLLVVIGMVAAASYTAIVLSESDSFSTTAFSATAEDDEFTGTVFEAIASKPAGDDFYLFTVKLAFGPLLLLYWQILFVSL